MGAFGADHGISSSAVATGKVVQCAIGECDALAFIATGVPVKACHQFLRLDAVHPSGRGPALPDLPTLTEQGYKFDANGWFGIFAPAGTPPAIVRRLNEEINRVLATEPMRQQFAAQNMATPPIKTVEQFAATVKSDIELWQSLGRTAKLQID